MGTARKIAGCACFCQSQICPQEGLGGVAARPSLFLFPLRSGRIVSYCTRFPVSLSKHARSARRQKLLSSPSSYLRGKQVLSLLRALTECISLFSQVKGRSRRSFTACIEGPPFHRGASASTRTAWSSPSQPSHPCISFFSPRTILFFESNSLAFQSFR